MKSVMISIQPKWVELIASGEKTIEVRKTRPKIETPFKCYIYETNWKDNSYWKNKHKGKLGKVIGEFVCDRIYRIGKRGVNHNFDYCYLSLNEWGNDDIEIEITAIKKSCISKVELNLYGANFTCLYGWHISNLKIYDKPKELGEFVPTCKYQCERCDICVFNEEAFGGCCRILTRPPQSWCYVEELGERL